MRGALLAAFLAAAAFALPACKSTVEADEKAREPSALTADLVDYRNGLAMLREGRVDEAIQQLSAAKQHYPRNAEVANALGLALLYRKDYKGASKQFSDALYFDPNLVEALNNRGVAAMEAGRLEDSEKDFLDVLSRPSGAEHANARYNLGLLRGRQLRWADAEHELTTCLADDAGSLKATRQRGLVRMKLENFRGALEDFLAVLREDAKDPIANYNAALCLLTTDRRDLAVRYMERTVQGAPDSEEAKKARRFLSGEPSRTEIER